MGRNTMTVTVLALHEPSMSTIRLIKGAQILKILKNYSMKKLIENINDWARYFMWIKKIVQSKHLKAQLGPPVNDEKVYVCHIFNYIQGDRRRREVRR